MTGPSPAVEFAAAVERERRARDRFYFLWGVVIGMVWTVLLVLVGYGFGWWLA
jgi:hypothetical protein